MGDSWSKLSSSVQLSSSSVRLSRKVTWKLRKYDTDNDFDREGQPFVEMLKKNPVYRNWMNAQTYYELKLVHRLPNLHWYLLVRQEGLPYFTLEITTSDMKDLIPRTRWFESCDEDASDVGPYEGSLFGLCGLADKVVDEMGTYNLMNSNCQHFCNRLLKKLHKEELTLTFESNPLDTDFDHCTRVHRDADNKVKDSSPSSKVDKITSDCTIGENFECTQRAKWKATEVKESPKWKLSEQAPPPTISDLSALFHILLPIADKWKDLGSQLAVSKLDEIEQSYGHIQRQCLREVLRQYLECPYYPPSWEMLANLVDEYNHAMANNIIKRAKTVA